MITNDALTPTRNEQITVDTSSIQIALSTFDRKVLVVENRGTTTISVSIGHKSAVNGAGIVLKPNYSFTDVQSEGYTPFQGSIQAISDENGGILSIFER